MLIEFNVTNYRSIRETQTLSLAASKYYKGLEETNHFDSGIGGLSNLLRTAVIYGPNAGGKSNLMKAIHFMKAFVLASHSHQEGQKINVVPFALSSETRSKASEFEALFVQDRVRYQYGFATTMDRITREWLLAYPEGKAQRWFERTYDQETEKENWYFGSKFVGRRQLWQEATRKNALFLSTAIQLNNEQLKPVFKWFQQNLAVMLPGAEINLNFSVEQCESEQGKGRIMEFMNSADLSIADIEVKKTPFKPEILPPNMPQELKSLFTKNMDGKDMTSIRFQHLDDKKESVFFDISDESDGTQKLFVFAGPLLDVLSKGRILCVDELDTSLHPTLVRFLVEYFQNNRVNRNNAQLVFTTHDTSILDTKLFRRDQVWFTERDRSHASRLFPLSDFSPRQGEALQKAYLQGRYGALPFIAEPGH